MTIEERAENPAGYINRLAREGVVVAGEKDTYCPFCGARDDQKHVKTCARPEAVTSMAGFLLSVLEKRRNHTAWVEPEYGETLEVCLDGRWDLHEIALDILEILK